MRNLLLLFFVSLLLVFQACEDDTPEPDPTPVLEAKYTVTYKITTTGDLGENPEITYRDADGRIQVESLNDESWEKEVAELENGDDVFLELIFTSNQSFSVELEADIEGSDGSRSFKKASHNITSPNQNIDFKPSVECILPCQ